MVAFLPDVDVARPECKPFVIVETAADHGEDAEQDGMENHLGVVDVADTGADAGGLLHMGRV